MIALKVDTQMWFISWWSITMALTKVLERLKASPYPTKRINSNTWLFKGDMLVPWNLNHLHQRIHHLPGGTDPPPPFWTHPTWHSRPPWRSLDAGYFFAMNLAPSFPNVKTYANIFVFWRPVNKNNFHYMYSILLILPPFWMFFKPCMISYG